MSKRNAAVGDVVRTDWALGSKDGRSHTGYVLAISPNGKVAKVDWNNGSQHPRLVAVTSLAVMADRRAA